MSSLTPDVNLTYRPTMANIYLRDGFDPLVRDRDDPNTFTAGYGEHVGKYTEKEVLGAVESFGLLREVFAIDVCSANKWAVMPEYIDCSANPYAMALRDLYVNDDRIVVANNLHEIAYYKRHPKVPSLYRRIWAENYVAVDRVEDRVRDYFKGTMESETNDAKLKGAETPTAETVGGTPQWRTTAPDQSRLPGFTVGDMPQSAKPFDQDEYFYGPNGVHARRQKKLDVSYLLLGDGPGGGFQVRQDPEQDKAAAMRGELDRRRVAAGL